MSEKNLVSVIMPCHNGERFISDSIDSVISQTYQNWELLVIDDNSTDNSVNIIQDKMKSDCRIKMFRNDHSVGNPAKPRNIGIENAQGRFIAFLDCDDIWLPNKLEMQLSLFDDNTSVIYSYYEKMDDAGRTSDRIIYSPSKTNFKEMLKSNVIGNLTGIYDTAKVGKVFQENVHHEDYLMWLEILKKGYAAKCCEQVLAYYRVSNHSLSSSKLKNLSWQWNIYRKELNLSFFNSVYLYFSYAFNGLFKYLK